MSGAAGHFLGGRRAAHTNEYLSPSAAPPAGDPQAGGGPDIHAAARPPSPAAVLARRMARRWAVFWRRAARGDDLIEALPFWGILVLAVALMVFGVPILTWWAWR